MRAVLIVLAAVLIVACSGEAEEPVPIADDPALVATEWLDAVAAGDTAAIETRIEPVGLAIVAAVENSLRSDETVVLIETGMTAELATQYWQRFRDGFATFAGSDLAAVAVGSEIPIPGSSGYRAFELTADGAPGYIVLSEGDLGWRVDFAATVGPTLIGPLSEYLESALRGDFAAEIATAYATAVVPALDAASALDPENTALLFEAEYIRQLTATTE